MSFLGGLLGAGAGMMGSAAAGANTAAGAQAIQGLISQGQTGINDYYNQGQSQLLGAYQGVQGQIANYFNQGLGMVSPWSQQGQGALATQAAALGLTGGNAGASNNIGVGRFSQPNTMNPYDVSNIGRNFTAQTNPGYAFAVQQGQQAIDASAAARGGLFSGANLKALDAYTVGQANQNFNTYVGQEQNAAALNFANMQTAYGNVAGMSGAGLTAGTTQANLAGTGMATNAQAGVANMGDLTALNTTGMTSLASLYGSGISGTASLYGANTAAQTQAWGQVGNSLGGMFQGMGAIPA